MEISLRGSYNGERGEVELYKWQDLKTNSGFSRHPKEDDRWWVSKCASIMGRGHTSSVATAEGERESFEE